jgi:hypothetical protein
MELCVYNESSRLNKTYIHIGQTLLNQTAKLANVFPYQVANFLYPHNVILPVCSFLFISKFSLLFYMLLPFLHCHVISVKFYTTKWGRDSAVVVATRYGLEGPGIEPRGARFSAPIQTVSGAHPASCKWIPGLSRG